MINCTAQIRAVPHAGQVSSLYGTDTGSVQSVSKYCVGCNKSIVALDEVGGDER